MQQMIFDNLQVNEDWEPANDARWPLQPTRQAGLQRLDSFVAKAGRAYQTHRNTDLGSRQHVHVSVLSPYLRHRMIEETEVLTQVLQRHTSNEAFKFVQEVFWRTYWKGWLEHRRGLWPEYQRHLPISLQRVAQQPRCFDDYQRAIAGETPIPLFNEWSNELRESGYLHNHARMWFASIWIFTLRLPWQLGADFFARHLIDGDPASNTLGWRWVAGLHTAGKTYLATAKNIRTCAELRLGTRSDQALGLNRLASTTFNVAEHLSAQALQKMPIQWPAPAASECVSYRGNRGRTTLLVTEEDLTWRPTVAPQGCVALTMTPRSVLAPSSGLVEEFVRGAIADAVVQFSSAWPSESLVCADKALDDDALVDWLVTQRMDEVICAYTPMGPTRLRVEALKDRLACKGIGLRMQLRDYDRVVWPHASKGFFQLGKRIPEFLQVMNLAH